MNSNQYYKVSVYIVGILCIALLLLIFQSIIVSEKHFDQNGMTLGQELRAYRQVLYDIKTSHNPSISDNFRSRCDHELGEVNELIDAYENGRTEEISLRTRFDYLAKQLLADPYLSITAKDANPMLNAKLDI